MSDDLRYVYCPHCEHEQLAESPPCPDGHGDECPDLACLECGTALSGPAVASTGATPRPERDLPWRRVA